MRINNAIKSVAELLKIAVGHERVHPYIKFHIDSFDASNIAKDYHDENGKINGWSIQITEINYSKKNTEREVITAHLIGHRTFNGDISYQDTYNDTEKIFEVFTSSPIESRNMQAKIPKNYLLQSVVSSSNYDRNNTPALISLKSNTLVDFFGVTCHEVLILIKITLLQQENYL